MTQIFDELVVAQRLRQVSLDQYINEVIVDSDNFMNNIVDTF